ncbi:MAG: hypothetical protein GW886_14965 [Rhodobacterales bacterium]|nr:hypothetical protein [Rhodobacterales bacterium]
MKLFDVQHPFFIPLHRRVILTAALAAWSVFEFTISGSAFWGVLTGGIALICAHQFFIAFDPPLPEDRDKDKDKDKSDDA